MFNYLEKEETVTVNLLEEHHTHSQRSFLFVAKEDITRSVLPDEIGLVPGTQQLHSVRGGGGLENIDVRVLACYCSECSNGDPQKCCNKDTVDEWKSIKLQKKVVLKCEEIQMRQMVFRMVKNKYRKEAKVYFGEKTAKKDESSEKQDAPKDLGASTSKVGARRSKRHLPDDCVDLASLETPKDLGSRRSKRHLPDDCVDLTSLETP